LDGVVSKKELMYIIQESMAVYGKYHFNLKTGFWTEKEKSVYCRKWI
jgi:hypothetical protein